MKTIEIFEPAMCCSTGLCGANVNPELLRISTVLNTLHRMGITISRYNLSNSPMQFATNQTVSEQIRLHGADRLPITVVDGKIAVFGRYPTNDEFVNWLSLPQSAFGEKENCCKGNSSCEEHNCRGETCCCQKKFCCNGGDNK